MGDYTFYSCPSLETVSLPEGLTSIGNRAFLKCENL
ncbi:MAG TPA: leucine-rich repeat protein [Bacillota bacterium]|nr:leucine-rich repeat protein [Bacillota bacterium]